MKSDIGFLRACVAVQYFKLDLSKDYFTLDGAEINRLEQLRKVCNFRGDNYQGRSRLRQFWYYLQKSDMPF